MGNRALRDRAHPRLYWFSKCQENHMIPQAQSPGYYHFCQPNTMLTHRHGRSTTPFMAANFADHALSVAELLKIKASQ